MLCCEWSHFGGIAMTSYDILQPVVALIFLTLIMQLWMYVVRLPAISAMGMKLDSNAPNGEQMSLLPAQVRWKADNYNHLLEQPTIFYATCFVLALTGGGVGLSLQLAWVYVAIRVAHSLQQALWNKIEVRFVLFLLSSIALVVLAVRAALTVF